MKNFATKSVYTDLALESAESVKPDECGGDGEIEGVEIEVERQEINDHELKITWIKILNEQGAEALSRPVGNYITLESSVMKINDVLAHEEVIKILSDLLIKLRKNNNSQKTLIVGLGNSSVTPDALGPRVVSKTLVTRHLDDEISETLKKVVSSVSAISPGVMGTTGIETCEIVKGIVEKISPDLVIAVDALAARKASRVNATIQMTDTGLSPGSGMGNMRKALNEETLGVPVIAIGVPTVVDAATLVNDTMNIMLEEMTKALPEGSEFCDILKRLEEDERYGLIKKALQPYVGEMFVTPKEVDAVIDRLSNIIGNSLNISLHPGISKEDINRYMY